MNPLHLCLIIVASVCGAQWLASIVTKDYSWVDRSWSIVPAVYLWVYAADTNFHHLTLNVMAVVSTIWGVRLTFNFARRGGYTGMEDYRWEVLRQKMTPAQFQIFNVFFIVLYQNLLLLLIALPAETVLRHPGKFGILDVVATVAFLLCTVGETIADQQQWNFQEDKRARRAAGHELTDQFVTTGLFKYSRHPNYFFEIMQWWFIFMYAAVAAGTPWIWTISGPALLTLLFVGSTRFTESITRGRYPHYAEYQQRVSAVIPWFTR